MAGLHASRSASGTKNATTATTTELNRQLTTDWYPVTFNLVYELPQFVAYFQRKQQEIEAQENVEDNGGHIDSSDQKRCSDQNCPRCTFYRVREEPSELRKALNAAQRHNIWILKPWNTGRGFGITISNNLDQIIRLCDTNPLIASRYVTDPVLFYRDDLNASVKFDVRYVILLRSVHPLKLFVSNVFWLRFANQSFDLNDFDNYGRHFTVMNYREDQELKHINCDEFIQMFEQQYPSVAWSSIQADIFRLLVDIFTTACTHPAPKGITASPQSRALYAIDLMLEWSSDGSGEGDANIGLKGLPATHRISPVVFEINYSPDCRRACKYYPEFFNHVFGCLFLDDPPEKCNMTQLV
ncbi:unnamed protein product [Echinostoma caproni]|uniref:TTL domain-containing protein n=1 Tax=Echinostoma caproni TaxID=27848 RepID=A0A3P8IWG4_9TREM|nr:unnamed protein product [Echinostoma caproni]